MDGVVFWTILSFAFVIATLGIVGYVFRHWWRASQRRRPDEQRPTS